MLGKYEKLKATQAVRIAAREKLVEMGVTKTPSNRVDALARMVSEISGIPLGHDPQDVLRKFVMDRPKDAVPSREINAMRQHPLEYAPALIVAANRARAVSPPMLRLSGRRERTEERREGER